MEIFIESLKWLVKALILGIWKFYRTFTSMGYDYKGWMWNVLVIKWMGQECTKCSMTFKCYILVKS